MILREQLKRVQAPLLSAVTQPLLPASVKAALGELSLLLSAMVEKIEQLEKEKTR